MKSLRNFLLIACLSASATFVRAQISDAGMWNTFSISKGFLDKFSADVDLELRLRDNFSRINLIYTNLGITYKPTKFLRISGVYRWIDKYRQEGVWGTRHRWYTDVVFRVKPANFILSYRCRWQWEVRDSKSYGDVYGLIPEVYWRNKFDIKYKINEWVPYVGVEIRYQYQNPRFPYGDRKWDRGRYYAGVDYEVNDRHTAGIYYLIQSEFNVVDPESLYILGLQYSISLK